MCIEAPTLAPPTLGLGLSLAPPALPAFSGDLGLCCKTVPYSVPALPLPLPVGALTAPGVQASLNAAFDAINQYLNAIPPDCPLE
jgi:hypothetical protein